MQSPSSSQHSSPSRSQEDLPTNPQDIGLDVLVEHFLAAKRSLLSATHVNRAQEIVASGREALERNAVLNARNFYVKSGIRRLIEGLEAVRLGCEKVENEVGDDFHLTVQALDVTDARLKSALEELRSTNVESSFRPENEPQKHLFDFIDETGVNELYDSIKSSIDRYESARSSFQTTCEEFDAEIERIHLALAVPDEERRELDRANSFGGTPVPELFAVLEEHASATAQHLEGLAKHYDLCVTALRHTEGGGEAIVRASTGVEGEDEDDAVMERGQDSVPHPNLVGLGVKMEQSDQGVDGTLHPISEEERLEMLAVLDKDATEVDEVTSEIRDNLFEMEEALVQVIAYVDLMQQTSDRQQNALGLVKAVSSHAAAYIRAATDFQAVWDEEKSTLESKREEVEASTDVFAGFIHAYDGLIVEVRRRSYVKAKMEKILRSALKEVEKLHKEDIEERENFRTDQADYLPSDLWSGLLGAPTKYTFRPVDDVNEEIVPEIDKVVYEDAVKRMKARLKT